MHQIKDQDIEGGLRMIRVVIADEQVLLRQGLRCLIQPFETQKFGLLSIIPLSTSTSLKLLKNTVYYDQIMFSSKRGASCPTNRILKQRLNECKI